MRLGNMRPYGSCCCVQFDAAYNDIAGVRVFAGIASKPTSSTGLAVWLSSGSGSSFNTTGVRCVTGLSIISEAFGAAACPALNGTRYVTVTRTDPATAEILVVHELQVTRASECMA